MSTRILNIEKLEKKFASLTRSRDSIQSLSLWIIKHKEFYKEIVNQWLDALKRDFNALTMFYVANDVIQNCGRKKAPEFRDAFATVLESAVSLEKVKEIKKEVTRMLTLWHDRAIYDDMFFKKLEEKLNAEINSESDAELEVPEAEVIANFKLENLINSLTKLKTLKDELYEKESFLEDIEEPVLSNIDNIIVKMESQRELRKCDKYHKLIEDHINLLDKVNAAGKTLLLDLKYSTTFYNAQLEDAKKVAHAYRIYGKKVKLLEKSLSEKLPILPDQSPVEAVISPKSPDVDNNTSQNSPDMSVSPSETSKSIKDQNEENMPDSCTNSNISNDCVIENTSKEKLECSVEKELDIPSVDSLSNTGETKNLELECVVKEITHLPTKDVVENNTSTELAENSSTANMVDKNVPKTQTDKVQAGANVSDDVDFLLEKAYDDQVRSKSNFKRKIDNLLKLQQSKMCKLGNDEKTKSPVDAVESSAVISKSPLTVIESTPILSNEEESEDQNSEFVSPAPLQDTVDTTLKLNDNDDNKTSEDKDEILLCNKSDKNVQNLQVSNDSKDHSKSENDQASTSLMFQSLPDIPTELLKTIIDKHRINMNLTSNTDINTTINEAVPENIVESNLDSSYAVKSEATVDNISSVNDSVPSESSEINNSAKENPEHLLVNEDAIPESNNELKSSRFLDALQNILDYFTNKNTYEEVKYSDSVNKFQPIPLENTLRIYNCLMQNNNKINSSVDLSSRSAFKEESIIQMSKPENNVHNATIEPKTNLNVSETVSLIDNNTTALYSNNSRNEVADNFSFISKEDNLEIMDMDVDSDDGGTM